MKKALFVACCIVLSCTASLALAGEWTADPATGCQAWNQNPQPNETISWSGACVDGKASGEGTLKYIQNNSATQAITCSFIEGKCVGKVNIVFPNGARYEGSIVDGNWSGKSIFISANGIRYEGDYANGAWHGKGVLSWPDGERYEGDFANGKRSGKGTYTFADGGRYEGDLLGNSFHGKGTRTFTSGAKYTGDYIEGKQTGKGAYVWPNGNRWEGNLVNSKFQGKGVFQWANGDRYEGDFVDDKRTGAGLIIWASGTRYEGGFLDGKPTGKGTKIWADGGRYEGDWKDGNRDGKGVQTWPNGHRYEGDWLADKLTGQGNYSWPNGTRYAGYWVDSKFQGYGERKQSNGRTERGLWTQDKLTISCDSDASCSDMKEEFSTPVSNCKVNDVDINKEYRGECRNGLAHGKGRAKGRDTYVGEFKDGNTHGQGTYNWATGDSYTGTWVNGERTHGKYKDKNGTYEGDFFNKNYSGFGLYKYSCNCSFWSCDTCTDRGWWQNGTLARSCDSKEACEKLNRLEPQIRKAEKESRCEDAKKLNQELEAINAGVFYYDSCVSDRKFNAMQRSNDPQEMYLAAGRYETDGERSRAKTIYRQIVDRFSKNPIAIKATDRLTRLTDVEAVESVGAANREAVYSANRRNAEQCENNRSACYSGCQVYKDYSQRSSCQNGCPICAK